MLYYLFRFLENLGIPGSGMWEYISFRSIMAFITALFISLWFGRYFIIWMYRHWRLVEEKRFEESVDPNGKRKKKFVPSMGGIFILVAVLIPCILFGRLRNIYLLLMIITTIWLGITGFMDDYLKIKRSKNGLLPHWKLLSQLGIGLLVGLTLYLSPDAVIRENIQTQKVDNRVEIVHKSEPVKSTITTIPFVKGHNLDYAWFASWTGKYKQPIGWLIFVIATVFFMMLISNGANINDGMDGMAAGNSSIVFVAIAILAYVSSHIGFAAYFNIMYIPHSEELVVYISAFLGALLGFLWYNANPAQVYMGDTGSLTIGGTIAVLAVIIHKELLLFILCGVFNVELLSSFLQTKYSAWGNKHGKKIRVFKRAPLHDSFRADQNYIQGVSYVFRHHLFARLTNRKITTRYWIISILLAALTIITLKIR